MVGLPADLDRRSGAPGQGGARTQRLGKQLLALLDAQAIADEIADIEYFEDLGAVVVLHPRRRLAQPYVLRTHHEMHRALGFTRRQPHPQATLRREDLSGAAEGSAQQTRPA